MRAPSTRTRKATAAGAAIALTGAGILAAAVPANAAGVVYTFNATYATGGTLTGTITFDAAACVATGVPECPGAYSDWNLVSSAGGIYGATTYTPANSQVGEVSSATALSITTPTPLNPTTALNLYFNPGLLTAGTSHSLAPFTLDGTEYASLELHAQYLDPPSPDAYRVINAGGAEIKVDPIPPASDGKVTVKTTKLKKLPNNKRTTVVKSAKVTPSSAGELKSIRVTCIKPLRGDVRGAACTHTKNLRTGKVTVTPLGGKGTAVTVTIKTKAKAGSTYQPQTWKKTWSVK